jgi:probable phosphoglycerate mutase
MPTKRIMLTRHGETTWNVNGRWQGQIDIPLNDLGREQARALGAALKSAGISTIYASDLARAWETAEIVGAAIDVAPQPDARWREMHLGIFQGLTLDEIKAQHGDEHRTFMNHYWDHILRDGESRAQVRERALAALHDAAHQDGAGATLVVTHGGPIRLSLVSLFDGHAALRDLHIPNTSLTTLDYDAGRWALGDVSSTAHLRTEARDLVDLG